MSERKYSQALKVKLCRNYLSGKWSFNETLKKSQVSKKAFRFWLLCYKYHGKDYFYKHNNPLGYSKELKLQCVREVLEGEGSVLEVTAKHKISGYSVLRSWIKLYNANIELTDTRKKAKYMAKTVKNKTTNTSKKITPKVSAEQCDLLKKFIKRATKGTTATDNMDEAAEALKVLELLLRENQQVKKELQESEMRNELLKKVKEFEGM